MDIASLLEYAIQAPSGDNCQPWRFRMDGDMVSVCNAPEFDTSLYNRGQQASYIAIGTLLENIEIAARHRGFIPEYRYFPDASNPDLIANITFSNGKAEPQELYPFIPKRATNRKPYQQEHLGYDAIKTIYSGQNGGSVSVAFTRSLEEIDVLAAAASLNEKIVLENESLHRFLFSHIVWSQAAMELARKGMFIKTLEMNPAAQALFKLASSWNRIKILNKFGFSDIVSRENRKIYRKSGAFGAIACQETTPLNLVLAGRQLQKIWLRAAREGLSLHPVTGIIFLGLKGKPDPAISETHAAMIRQAYGDIEKIFRPAGRIVFMFRIGTGAPPSAISLKLPLSALMGTNANR